MQMLLFVDADVVCNCIPARYVLLSTVPMPLASISSCGLFSLDMQTFRPSRDAKSLGLCSGSEFAD